MCKVVGSREHSMKTYILTFKYMTTEKPLKEHIIFSKATAWKLASGVVMTPKSVSGNEHEARH